MPVEPIDVFSVLTKPDGTPTEFFLLVWQTLLDAGTGTVSSVDGASSAGGFSLTGGPITESGTLTFGVSNAAAARAAIGAGTGSGSVTSVDGSGGVTGLSLIGGPITGAGTLTLGGTLSVGSGGTGSTTAPNARTALGLTIGVDVQAYSAKLAAYAGGDTPSAFTLSIVDSIDAAAWRTAIGAGTSSTVGTVTSVDSSSSASGFSLTGGPITSSGTLTFAISNATNARSSLGLVIGTDVQAYSAKLAAYAGGDTPSAFTLGIVDSVDAAAWRTAIGAGTSSVTPAALTKTDDTNVTLTLGGTPATSLLQATSLTLGWSGTLAVARGGTAASTAAGARTNLGLDAGGAGDIWVQRAGDTMSGNLSFSGGLFTYSFAGGSIGTVRAGIQYDGSGQTVNFYTANTFRGFVNSAGELVISAAIQTSTYFRNATYTVAGAPSASTAGAGAQIYVTNPSVGAARPYWSNGTNWYDAAGVLLA